MDDIVLIPAAGRGSRLGSTLPKALVPVNGSSMLEHLLRLYDGIADRFIVVVAPAVEQLFRQRCGAWSQPVELAVQHEQTGMLDAILAPHARIAQLRPRRVWITWCDQVAVHPGTVARLRGAAAAEPAPALALPTILKAEPYIHFERDSGRISGVRQRREGDAMPDIGEGDLGLFNLSLDAYVRLLPEFAEGARPAPGTAERNFLPFIPWLSGQSDVVTVPATNVMESIGINTPAELELVAGYLSSGEIPAGAAS